MPWSQTLVFAKQFIGSKLRNKSIMNKSWFTVYLMTVSIENITIDIIMENFLYMSCVKLLVYYFKTIYCE